MTDWNNKEEVLEAVREDYGAFEKASAKLQKDKEIFQEVKKRILSDYEDEYLYEDSFRQLPKQMRADREIVLAAVEMDGESLQWASEELKDDKEVVLAAIHSWCTALEFASDALKTNREFLKEVAELVANTNCANVYGLVIKALETDFSNKEKVMAVIKENKDFFEYVPECLKNDPEFMKEVKQYL